MNLEEVLPEEWFPVAQKAYQRYWDNALHRNPFARMQRICFNPEECPLARKKPHRNTLDCGARTRCILTYPTEQDLEALR